MQPRRLIKKELLEWLPPGLVVLIAWCFFYFPLISGSKIPGFRDGSHFYLPLYTWIAGEIDQGNLPFWNPNENLGTDVVGDASSAMFYPPKLLLHVPIGDYIYRYGLYIALHGLLAIINTIVCAQVIGCRKIPATIAGLSFGLSGPVLFSSTNVIFLVGCSWLPLSVAYLWSLFKRGSFTKVVALSFCLAMMILGGDPQMACHVVFIAGLLLLSQPKRVFSALRPSRQRSKTSANSRKKVFGYVGLVSTAVVLASCLAAIQILPSYSKARQSTRSYYSNPHSLFHLSEYAGRQDANWDGVTQGFFGAPETGMHHEISYQFSQPPWTIVECLWPNISGKPYPVQQRWSDGLPGADRVWNPSLYFGLLVVLYLFVKPAGRRRTPCRWLITSGTFFVVGSFGWFGLGWLIKECLGDQSPEQLGPQVGGLYWLLASVVPLYSSFRYPAKLFVVAIFCFSIAAALKLDSRNAVKSGTIISRNMLLFTWFVLLGMLIAYGLGYQLPENLEATTLFGPLDHSAFYPKVIFSLVHSSILCGFIWSTCKITQKSKWSRAFYPVLLMLVVCDIVIANYWLIPTTKRANISTPEWFEKCEQESGETLGSKPRIYRFDSQQWQPGHWFNSSHKDRLNQIQQWEYQTFAPRTGLLHGAQVCNSFASIESIDDFMLDGALANNSNPQRSIDGKPIEWLRLIGVDYLVFPTGVIENPIAQLSHPGITLFHREKTFSVWRLNNGHERVYAINDPLQFKETDSRDSESVYKTYESFVRSFLDDPALASLNADAKVERTGAIKHSVTSNEILLECSIEEKQWLVIGYRYSPYLVANARRDGDSQWRRKDIEPVYGILSGLELEPGNYQIKITYRNPWLVTGSWISCATIFALTIVFGFAVVKRIRFKNAERDRR